MTTTITREDLDTLEREYENAIKSNIKDDDDVFLQISNIGMCRIKKSACRGVIDKAQKEFNDGKMYVSIKLNVY